MHRYRKPGPKADIELPPIDSLRFVDALDVVAWAELDRTIGWRTWPEVWHLDDEGRFCCYTKASSLDSIRWWAERDAGTLWRSRREGRAAGTCPDRWVVVESRQPWMFEGSVMDERDAAAFLRVRQKVRRIGVRLVDAVIFDDDGHWWSMQELTSGSTAWT